MRPQGGSNHRPFVRFCGVRQECRAGAEVLALSANRWDSTEVWRSYRTEIDSLLAQAVREGGTKSGHFGGSGGRFFGVISPIRTGPRAGYLLFEWLGPSESQGELVLDVNGRPVERGRSASAA